MSKYIELIAKCCPLFHAHFEAHKRNLEEIEHKRIKLVKQISHSHLLTQSSAKKKRFIEPCF